MEDWIKRSSCALVLALSGNGSRSAQLPIPCLVHSCGTTGPSQFVTSGNATAVQAGNTLTVQQASNKAILNWSSFNVSADGKVVFNQPTATSIALNRIFDVNPSTVFGSVSANGQIYLINPNGFVFGSTAKVNVSGLIASSLGIADSTFTSGLLAPQLLTNGTPALSSNAAVLAANGTPAFDSSGNPILGSVTVAAGAQISANSGGRIMLAAPLVQNAGSIQAADGQVVLAAGQNVYLQASNDPALRGLIVEVDGAGKAWNQLTGALSAPRGNISLVGLAVNQDGRISATTTVSANGSVSLEAGNTPTFGGTQIASTKGGTLELGAGSSIDILPELSDTATAVVDQPQLPSTVTLSGQQILMHGGEITAPAGTLKITASANPSAGVVTDGNTDARVRIDAGTKIDLSGSTAELPMSANLVAVQLRGAELADDPNQQNGALRGQTVYVDARVGTPIANVSSAIGTVPLNIAQRTESGGSAIIESEGDVVVQQGVSINVSGGKTVYDGGVLQTTQLIGANGKLYDIGSASPLLTYTGVLNPTFTQTFNKWGVQDVVATPGLSHYEAGYVQGANAGNLTFAAPSMVLNGTLIGHVDNGPFQRTDATRLSGGTLTIGLSAGLTPQALVIDFLSPSVDFTNAPFPVVVDDAAPLPPATLELPVDYLVNGGFTNTAIYSNSRVSLPANLPLQLIPGSAFAVQAARIDIFSDITALGGALAFRSVLTVGSQSALIPRSGISIGDGVTLDVRGQWTNDSPTLNTPPGVSPTLQNGGSIALELTVPGSELVLGGDVSLQASGGAWINSANQMTAGKGGSIALLADPAGSAFQVGPNVAMDAFGVGTAAGGTLDLSAPRLALSNGSGWTMAQRTDDTASPSGVFAVYAPLFSDYGFSNVVLSASGLQLSTGSPADALTVTAGTQVMAQAQSLQLDSGYLTRPTGGTVSSFAHTVVLPEISRPAESVTLTVLPNGAQLGYAAVIGVNNVGLLDLQTGASITVDPGAAISLSGVGGVSMNGTLRAPGGMITLETLTPNNPNLDPGYVAGLNVEIGANAILDTSGTARLKPNDAGLRLGSVLSGGTIDLFADRGSVIADPGSKIDFSGSSALLDIQSGTGTGHYTRETVASAGGALNVHAPEAIALLGSVRGTAGMGQLGRPDAGSLDIVLSRSESWYSVPSELIATFPTTPRVISIVSSTAGSQPSAAQYGLTTLGADLLLQSGIDSVRLEAGNAQAVDASRVEIDTNAPLSFVRQITLDAPVIAVGNGYDASLNAASIAIGNSLSSQSPAATSGDGSFNASAQHLDLFGAAVFNGTKSVTLTSAGDILLQGAASGSRFSGSLSTGGDLTLNSARIYPATDTAFSIISTGAGNTVDIGQSGVSPGVPLSAAGSIMIAADNITSTGTLLAPFGSIDLEAGKELTLGAGSLTSVSADGAVIPYGNTQLGGKQWVYTGILNALPARQVTVNAPDVTVANGAVVDLRGGGDLYAYEWVPGTGGTKDRLSNDTSALGGGIAGLYAIVPSMMGQYAPYDPLTWAGSSLAPGTSVYLSGGGGIAAGIYPLLPARYALLPGAQLVQVESGYQNIVPGQSANLPNGTPIVAGYLTFGNTGNHPADYTAFAILPAGYAHTIAGYQDSFASTFFAPAAAAGQSALPVDAGRLSISVGAGLHVAGDVLTAAASTGHAAEIDISASALDVTAQAANPLPGAVDLPASVIQGWNPGTLILGGRPSQDESSIAVSADTVTIGNGAQLSADQIVVVANTSIDLQPGATLLSTSAAKSTPPSAAPILSNIAITSSNPGGAAFLAVSDQALLIAQRSSPGTASGGIVNVESGATLATRGALSLDAPGGAALSGTVSVTGASVSLSSSSIGILTSGTGDVLVIDANHLDALNQSAQVRLASQGAIDIGAPFTLGVSTSGVPTLASLTLIGTGLNALANSNVELGAQNVTLQGANAAAAVPTMAAAGGTLGISAGELDVGSGTFVINGFAHTSVAASGAVVGRGSGSLIFGGDLSVNAPQLTAAAASNTLIYVPNGTLTIGTAPALGPTAAPLIGGSLALAANSIQDDAEINVQGGLVSLQSAQDLTLGPTASINAGGSLVNILGQSIAAAGGAVNLSAGGNVDVASGSTLNVAAAGTGNAGTLSVFGRGTVTLQGQLSGSASSSAIGGSVFIDAGQLGTDLNTLSAGLSTGGFTNQINVHTQSGDLNLNAASALTANQVILTADTGTVRIDGTITALSAGQRGQIGLFGGSSVQIDGSAALRADGAGATGLGGQIELGTGSSGTVSLASGSVVSALGSQGMGTLLIRAPALGGSDVAISSLPTDLRGIGLVLIEPISTFAVSTAPTAADFGAIESAVAGYMSAAGPAISSRLNAAGSLPLVVRPAVDLTASGNLTFADPLDLSSWRYAGQSVDLTVRAAGSISIDSAVSDGFVAGLTSLTNPSVELGSGPSASLRFVAGAGQGPNPLGLNVGSGADLTLASGAVVRTGTGDLDLVAARDVVFSTGSSAYTAGLAATAAVPVPSSNHVFSFPSQGGNVLVSAGRDIQGAPVSQSISDWQVRQGNTSSRPQPVQWGVDLNQFGWNIGALGGGDVRLTAGRDILNVSAAASDSEFVSNGAVTHVNSGGLEVSAGGDVGSGQFYVADGIGTLRAGGAFSAVRAITGGVPGANVGSLIALNDAQVSIQARLDVDIDAVVNPTTLSQNLTSRERPLISSYFTYGEDSSLSIQSTAGSVLLQNQVANLQELEGPTAATGYGGQFGQAYPASLTVRSLQQDITINGGFSLFPSANGQFELTAGRDIVGNPTVPVIMSDALASALPTPAAPGNGGQIGNDVLTPFAGARHASDALPASITAGRDIISLNISIPKAAQVSAGRDIADLTYAGQNLNPLDLTVLSAGRDFIDSLSKGSDVVQVGGPGAVDVVAGRNIDLGFSDGIATIGNLKNPNLAMAQGADLTIVAGLTQAADFGGFLKTIIEPSSVYQQSLVNYVEAQTGESGLTSAQATDAFTAFTVNQQRALIDQVFFAELLLSGREANTTPGAGFTRGYAAIDALFPMSRAAAPAAGTASSYAGDLSLTFSRIYTISGGGISLLVPGGQIDVGLANPPPGVPLRQPSQLGIVAQGAGDVDIYSKGDVLVNASRIFTLGGGNILIWSDEGSIDAGRGSKSSLSVPPPQIVFDALGNATLSLSGAVAGSGIRTIQIDPSVAAGNVDLIAPVGTVNAGDAGIGAAGNINIAAQTVLGASNINFGGSATGVPAQVSNIGASLAGASAAAGSATNAATASANQEAAKETTAPLAQTALSWLDVFVTGLGEENCKPEDLECLKRQIPSK